MELIEGDHELNPENRNKNFSFHSFIIFISHGFTSSRSKLVNILLVFHSATDWSTRVLRLYCMQQRVHYNETKQEHITIQRGDTGLTS